jgi:hypothetical protein
VEHLRELALAAGARLQAEDGVATWTTVLSCLLTLAEGDDAPLRTQASDATADICLAATGAVPAAQIEADGALQQRLLAPVLTLAATAAADVQLRHLGTLFKLLQGGGQSLSVGWPAILETLAQVRPWQRCMCLVGERR